RADLRAAGITREVLFTKAPNVEPLRFHDGGRATFVTWAKRAGKSDGWIADRTGHLTSSMIERYTRAARTLEDLKIEPFPELAEALDRSPGGGRGGESTGGPPAPASPASGSPSGAAGLAATPAPNDE